jgi:hypothetical protein
VKTLDSLGPVCNPDGSPSDVTRAMLAGTGRDPDDFARDAAAAALAASTGNGPGSRCTHYHRDDRRCSARVPSGSRYYCDAHAGGDPCGKCRRTVKVRVSLVVTIDLDDYRLNYGTDDPDVIRDDVRYATLDAVNSGAVLHDGVVDVSFSGGAK